LLLKSDAKLVLLFELCKQNQEYFPKKWFFAFFAGVSHEFLVF